MTPRFDRGRFVTNPDEPPTEPAEPEPVIEPEIVESPPEPEKPPVVVLLHGLGRRATMMVRIELALEATGFESLTLGYDSTTDEIPTIAERLADLIHGQCANRPLHVVTHSLGGIVFRHMKDERLDWRRAVLVAPPNGGSAVAAALSDNPIFQALAGPAGGALAGANGVDASAWPYPPCPFGVIAGTRRRSLANPTSWISHRIFPKGAEHDGTVAVDETKLDGMAAFATVDASHTMIMDDDRVHALVIKFLKDGVF